MAHYAGLVAAKLHDDPVPVADFVTTTTHKTLRGPRAGLCLAKKKYAKTINSRVFPGIQGGPLMHVVAGKAVCFGEALKPEFKTYIQQVIDNAQVLAETLASGGLKLVSGGTDNHLLLVNVLPLGVGGKTAEQVGRRPPGLYAACRAVRSQPTQRRSPWPGLYDPGCRSEATPDQHRPRSAPHRRIPAPSVGLGWPAVGEHVVESDVEEVGDPECNFERR